MTNTQKFNLKTGTIYIARSLSRQPTIAAHREVFHKIGRTTTNTKTRLARAKDDPTYLFAPVEVVQEYDANGGDTATAEKMLHNFFKAARIDLTIPAQGGHPATKPKEWFLVPLAAISEAVQRINDGSLSDYWYDRKTQTIRERLPEK